MSIIVPDTIEVQVLTQLFSVPMILKIYGNDVTPNHNSKAGDFTEIDGGGYDHITLLTTKWTTDKGDPSAFVYQEVLKWIFVGVLNPPGTIYGYYVVKEGVGGELVWAERFPSGVVPFSPIAGSIVKVLPKFTCQSAF